MSQYSKTVVKDKEYRKLVRNISNIASSKVKVGYWGNGDPSQNLAYRAAIMTFGIPEGIDVDQNGGKMRRFLHSIGIHLSKNTHRVYIPMRPFMQNSVDGNKPEIFAFIKKEFILVLKGQMGANTFLKRIGVFHKAQIQDSIRKGNYKELHPVTIAQKGSSKPLISGGELLNKVDYKVE